MVSTVKAKPLVTFWGTRGSIATPGRITEKYGGNTPCVSVRYGDILIIFDAGTGIRNLGLELMEEFGNQEGSLSLHLFLSHTHWDHIQGLPFFLPAYDGATSLNIYGSPMKGRFLSSILEGLMDFEYFPVSLSDFSAGIHIREISDEAIDLGSITIDCQEQIAHPGGSVRYRVNADGKRIIYSTDVELDPIFNPDSSSEENRVLARDYLDFIKDADLLIAEAQYTAEEYRAKAGWGHTSVPLLLDLAHRSRVKRLAVFHHDPEHSDEFLDELWKENRAKYLSGERQMEVFWAREGITLAIE